MFQMFYPLSDVCCIQMFFHVLSVLCCSDGGEPVVRPTVDAARRGAAYEALGAGGRVLRSRARRVPAFECRSRGERGADLENDR